MGPDYKVHDPKGWCGDPRRGAALGRGSYHLDDDRSAFTGKLFLRKVKLDSGGYDANGTYWGGGTAFHPVPDLYWVANEEQDIDFCFRARNREEAKATVRREHYPNARFYR